ncbi:MAG: spore coat protein CotJB [Oscillospiraceae bacterium]|nr:spore coat protein CotJB [Oscillospiraceae bacterium]
MEEKCKITIAGGNAMNGRGNSSATNHGGAMNDSSGGAKMFASRAGMCGMRDAGCSGVNGTGSGSYRKGALPSTAPLAMAYVPMQESSSPAYDTSEALQRGTLFPGLDLPLMNIVNTADVTDTPLGELMALQFATRELHLYLDTHPDDTEAFEMLKEMLNLFAEARRRYVKQYGPLVPEDLAESETFTWLSDPWPWMYEKD